MTANEAISRIGVITFSHDISDNPWAITYKYWYYSTVHKNLPHDAGKENRHSILTLKIE